MTTSLIQQQERQLNFLKEKVAKFISHKKRIFNNSKMNEPLHTAQFLKAVDVLDKELAFAAEYGIGGYANVVNRNIENFKMLLPHPNNDSYTESLNCIDMLQGLCAYYLKQNGNG